MKTKLLVLSMLSMAVFLLTRCSTGRPARINLFNGKDFQGWTFFLADSMESADQVWSVENGVVHCKGVPNGYMRTTDSFSEYKLHVEWRWADKPTNSGVLLHCQGPDQVWPNCLECQLMAGNAGDFVFIGPNQLTVKDSTWSIEEGFAVIPKNHESNEKPAGEWNSYDIVVSAEKIQCSVNGVLQNSGTRPSLSSGFIGLQSEGSPIEFRNIWIEK